MSTAAKLGQHIDRLQTLLHKLRRLEQLQADPSKTLAEIRAEGKRVAQIGDLA